MDRQIRKYYRRHKKDLASLALVFAGIIMFFWIILPQIGEVSDTRSNISTQEQTNADLYESSQTLTALNPQQLDVDFELVMGILPAQKSVGRIFEALTLASGRSNVEIGSLNVQVGNVYSTDQSVVQRGAVDGVPLLNMLVRVTGSGTQDLTEFANMLYETGPIVGINSVGISGSEGRYDLDFYFKPINEKAFEAQTIVTPLTSQQRELLTTLDSWIR